LPGEPSQGAVVPYAAAAESAYQLKARSASKLPVSAPGRAALPNATPNLNIGIDLWTASQPVAVIPVQGEASPGLALARADAVGHLVWNAIAKAYANMQRVVLTYISKYHLYS
jgi:plant G-box-binding factor